MMKSRRWKKVGIGFLLIILNVCALSVQVSAQDYYNRHKDWSRYCMRAHDIEITEATRQAWLKTGKLAQEVADKCQLAVKTGDPNDGFATWGDYTGALTADTNELEQLSGSNTKEQVMVTFYIAPQQGETDFLSVQVTVTKAEIGEAVNTPIPTGTPSPITPTPATPTSEPTQIPVTPTPTPAVTNQPPEVSPEGPVQKDETVRQETMKQDVTVYLKPRDGQTLQVENEDNSEEANEDTSNLDIRDDQKMIKDKLTEIQKEARGKGITLFSIIFAFLNIFFLTGLTKSIQSDLEVLKKYRRIMEKGDDYYADN